MFFLNMDEGAINRIKSAIPVLERAIIIKDGAINEINGANNNLTVQL